MKYLNSYCNINYYYSNQYIKFIIPCRTKTINLKLKEMPQYLNTYLSNENKTEFKIKIRSKNVHNN